MLLVGSQHLEQPTSTKNRLKKNLKIISLVETTCKIQLQKNDKMVRNVWKKVPLRGGRGGGGGGPTPNGKSLAALQCHT